MECALERTRAASRVSLKVIATVSFIAPLLTRLLVGYAFYITGKGKVGNLEGITEFFTSLGIPFPAANAWFVSHLEYFGGMLLMIGLATRPVAALLGSTMIVALLTADRADFLMAWSGEGEKGLLDIVPVAYGAFLSWLLLYGPGMVSLDALLRHYLKIDPVKTNPDNNPQPSNAAPVVA
jgi:putative oxidoreductase